MRSAREVLNSRVPVDSHSLKVNALTGLHSIMFHGIAAVHVLIAEKNILDDDIIGRSTLFGA